MFEVAIKVATLFLQPTAPEPPPHCSIETRVWCVEYGASSISMNQDRGARVWTVIPSDSTERVIVTESLNCDAVNPDGGLDKANTRETRKIVGGKLNTEIVYGVPGYECEVKITWSSDPEDLARLKGQTRRRVLSVVWVGVHEKRPLFDLIER